VSEIAAHTSLRSPVLIRENDGVQVLGTTVLDAFDRLKLLESTAEATTIGPALNAGAIHCMPDDDVAGPERASGPGAPWRYEPWPFREVRSVAAVARLVAVRSMRSYDRCTR
jgi:hypothetical protein